MELEKYIGKIVLFNVRPEFLKENRGLFQRADLSRHFYGRIVAVDGVGVWLDNPTWKTRPEGSDDEEMTYRMHFLVPWSNIISIGAFPDRKFSEEEGKEAEEQDIKRIGF
jgi:hypothetical protein